MNVFKKKNTDQYTLLVPIINISIIFHLLIDRMTYYNRGWWRRADVAWKGVIFMYLLL